MDPKLIPGYHVVEHCSPSSSSMKGPCWQRGRYEMSCVSTGLIHILKKTHSGRAQVHLQCHWYNCRPKSTCIAGPPQASEMLLATLAWMRYTLFVMRGRRKLNWHLGTFDHRGFTSLCACFDAHKKYFPTTMQ